MNNSKNKKPSLIGAKLQGGMVGLLDEIEEKKERIIENETVVPDSSADFPKSNAGNIKSLEEMVEYYKRKKIATDDVYIDADMKKILVMLSNTSRFQGISAGKLASAIIKEFVNSNKESIKELLEEDKKLLM